MGKYINNLETNHIELHFEKSEYMALTDRQKSELKKAYLWSKSAGAWVSRSTSNHYWAIETAKKLGFTEEVKQGERLSYAEQLAVKVEKAEHRVECMEEHAANAAKRAENLQAEFNSYHGDISFFTQPNINSSRGRAFTNYRNRVIARFESGMEEYRKSEYFKERAATAQETADMKQLKDPIYLHNRIKECNSNIKKLQSNIVTYEDKIFRIGNGEVITSYTTHEPLTVEYYESLIQRNLEKMEWEMDKLAFMENCLDEIGGNKFSKENIKPGYIVKIRRWGNVLVTSTGPVNFSYKMIFETGNLKDWPGQDPYEAIIEIVEAKEIKEEIIENPYKTGNILCAHRPGDNSIYKAYQVIKTTATGVKLQQIAVENGLPVADRFINDKQVQRKITKSKWSDFVGVYEGDWQLHKYEIKEAAGVV
jgi:hypothetical protein